VAAQTSRLLVNHGCECALPPWPVNLTSFTDRIVRLPGARASSLLRWQAEYPTLHVYQYERKTMRILAFFETFESAYGMKLLDTVRLFLSEQYVVSDSAEPQIAAAVATSIQHGATGPG